MNQDRKDFIDFLSRQRDKSLEVLYDNQSGRDSLVLTISGGAFSVSIAFFAFLPQEIFLINILFFSWYILGTSLVLQIINYELAIKDAGRNVKFLNENINSISSAEWETRAKKTSPYFRTVMFINFATIVLTIVGVVLLIVFAVTNIESRHNIQQKYTVSTTTLMMN